MIQKVSLMFSLVLLLALVGCSKSTTDSTEAVGSPDLNSEFGGYSSTNESFAFGEAQLITESSDDADFDDPILRTAGFDSLAAHPHAGRYHFRVIWGKLRYDSSITNSTDWTGSLEISRGGEVIRRLIHWELNQDFIIPREERTLVEWISYTSVHNDGIAVDLIVPPLPPTFDSSYVWVTDSLGDSTQALIVDTIPAVDDNVEVTFRTGPYSRTFALRELEALDTVVYLADSNAVAFHALKVDRRECPAGFFNGFWGYNENGRGLFRGMWVVEDGHINGFVRGHFGVNDDGLNVLFGKYIGRDGQFKGFIKGTYRSQESDSALSHGQFMAKIFNSERMQIGVLEGRFRSSDDVSKGFMQGRWKTRCRTGDDRSEDSMRDGM